jgi:hypothetical protein
MSPNGVVTVDDTALLINGLVVRDTEVVQAARTVGREGSALDGFVQRMLKAGIAASSAVSHSNDLALLERAVRDADQKVGAAVQQQLAALQEALRVSAEAEISRLTTGTNDALERLSLGVTRLVSGDTGVLSQSVQGSVRDLVEETRRALQELMVLQARTTQTTLNDDRERIRVVLADQLGVQHRELRVQLDGIREALAVLDATKRSRQASPARGDDYEDAAKDLIASIAIGSGDLSEVDDTSLRTGADGLKKGDVVVTVQSVSPAGRAAPRIVFEAKDRRGSNRPSARALITELRKCRSNRMASCSIALLPAEAMPVHGHKIVLLEPRSVAVQWNVGDEPDLVVAAFHLMKLLAVSESPDSATGLDPKRLREHFERLSATVEQFNDLERQVGTADRAVTRIREIASGCRAALVRNLGELHDDLLGSDQRNGHPDQSEGTTSTSAAA